MAEHTKIVCATECNPPMHCCDALFCQMAIDFARKNWGIDLTKQVVKSEDRIKD